MGYYPPSIRPNGFMETLPEWFEGELYKEGSIVKNRFSGEEIELTAVELSMYDFIMGCTMIIECSEYPFIAPDKVVTDLRNGLDWFKENNIKAYMVLLD
jgi:hypothetical protein